MSIPGLAVDAGLELPPYQQIVQQVRAAIERGELGPGVALPAVRALALELRVAPNTVARAYTELQGEGWLSSDGRRGTRVATDAPINDAQRRREALLDAVARFVETLRHRGFTLGEVAEAFGSIAR